MAALLRKIFKHRNRSDHEKHKTNSNGKRGNQESSSTTNKIFHKKYSCGEASRVGPVIETSEEQSPVKKESQLNPNHLSQIRTKRLMKELRELKLYQERESSPSFTVDMVNDNLYEWNVKLYKHGIDSDSDLYRDMREMGIRYILINIVFPITFPFAPPFIRIVGPPIEKGFVMEGGAICMELLTPRGWASAYTVEAVIMQFSASIVKGQGRVGRRGRGRGGFSRRTAEESFRSLVKTHDKYGWLTPPLAEG